MESYAQPSDALALPDAQPAVATAGPDVQTLASYGTMRREIRSWALWCLVVGAIHLVTNGFLSAPWGILLIAVGLASFYFRDTAMFVIYGVTLASAALSNLVSGEAIWAGIAIVQVILAVQVFRNFFRFRQVQADVMATDAAPASVLHSRSAARVFPWAGCALGSLSLAGLVTIFVGGLLLVALSASKELPGWFGAAMGVVLSLATLGFAVGLASVLSRHPRRWAAIIGMVAALPALVVEVLPAVTK